MYLSSVQCTGAATRQHLTAATKKKPSAIDHFTESPWDMYGACCIHSHRAIHLPRACHAERARKSVGRQAVNTLYELRRQTTRCYSRLIGKAARLSSRESGQKFGRADGRDNNGGGTCVDSAKAMKLEF